MSDLGSLLELVGPDATLTLIEHYGGVRLCVPPRMKTKHRLRAQIGDSAMALLVQYFGGLEFEVPLARRWRIEVYKERGMGPTEIARKVGCHRRFVHAHLARLAAQQQASFDFGTAAKPHDAR